MKKIMVGLFGLLILALPQVASAQSFAATFVYTAKFLCGSGGGENSRAGVVSGHYNTTVNVRAQKNKTALAYKALATKVDGVNLSEGTVSDFSERFNFDRDGGLAIVCSNIKRDLFDAGGTGFFEGFVMIYSSLPLDVTDVVTGEECTDCGVRSIQIYQVADRPASVTVKPRVIL